MKLCDQSIKDLCLSKTIHLIEIIEMGMDGGDVTSLNRVTRTINGNDKPMISPFVPESINTLNGQKIPSYGLSSAGYDVRLADQVKIFTNMYGTIIDPRKMTDDNYIDVNAKIDEDGLPYVLIPPNSYLLGYTIETFSIPRDIVATCIGKSTYARSGCAVNVTPIEPGFEGQVVIEIANQTTSPMKVYTQAGIAQFQFEILDRPCEVSYADRGGKYQNQTGITQAKV